MSHDAIDPPTQRSVSLTDHFHYCSSHILNFSISSYKCSSTDKVRHVNKRGDKGGGDKERGGKRGDKGEGQGKRRYKGRTRGEEVREETREQQCWLWS